MDEKEFGVLIKHLLLINKNTVEAKCSLYKCYRASALSKTTVKRWFSEFKSGRTDTNDAERSRRPNEALISKNIKNCTKYFCNMYASRKLTASVDLVTYLETSRDLCETTSILFGAALAVYRIICAKLSTAGRATGQSSVIPAWRIRIEERIAKARALIGRQICFRSGNNRPRIVRTVRLAFAGTNVSLSQPDIMQKLTERIDDLKQRIAAWGKRIQRYTERSTRFNKNRLFQSDQKRLYKSLERSLLSGTGPALNQADTVAFWHGLWSEPVNHSEGPWTKDVVSQCASITPMNPVIITPDDVAEAVRRAPNWKILGLDGLHHYWLKGFMVCHAVLARQFRGPQPEDAPKTLHYWLILVIWFLKIRVPQTRANIAPSRVYRPYTRHLHPF
ncbi:unnamed protein product [Parnassius apollo]|uniref:(apollo) hypothetical protein n=1 Tax=Parnassius apollo TaxID=110799 RepID=A0A8S3YBR0_PARAO|nr:unnamed protein product [Parnassius apollo]